MSKLKCIKCSSHRLLTINGKVSDMFSAYDEVIDYDGYVPKGLGIGGGDYISFQYCLNCGQIQNKFPITEEMVAGIFGLDSN